ncbi:MAG: DUF1996 domain-containing protein [Anaerolineae bacterium]
MLKHNSRSPLLFTNPLLLMTMCALVSLVALSACTVTTEPAYRDRPARQSHDEIPAGQNSNTVSDEQDHSEVSAEQSNFELSAEKITSPLFFSSQPPAVTYDRYASFDIGLTESANDQLLECRLNNESFADCESNVFISDVQRDGEQIFTARIKDDVTTEVSYTWQVLNVFESDTIDLLPSTQVPDAADPGSWRGILRINCDFSHSSYNDPIVFPGGESMAHLHRFYGNEQVDHNTTMESLLTTGDSTCQGGELNRSAYWVPTLLAPDYDSVTNERMIDENGDPAWKAVPAVVGTNEEAHEVFYYSAAIDDLDAIQPIPAGLRIIAGDHTTMPGETQDTSIVRWHCQSWESNDHSNPRWSATIPECLAPDRVRMDVFFPSCWNGIDLDSDDHKSHMAYPIKDSTGETVCPDTHPVAVVRPTYHYAFGVRPDVYDPVERSSKGWRLASDGYEVTEQSHGGLSLHADWFNGWHPAVMEAILETCIQGRFDCHNGNLADGWRLSEAKEGIQEEPAIINDGLGMGSHHHQSSSMLPLVTNAKQGN